MTRQLKIDLTKKKWKDYSDLPIDIKSIIESRLEKIRYNTLIEGARQFVDTDGKTIHEVIRGIHVATAKYPIDWEAIVALAEDTNSTESLPEPIMELILKRRYLDRLIHEIHDLWDWLEGLDELILAQYNKNPKKAY